MEEVNLSATQLDRYARQLVLEGFGGAGQAALSESNVLVVGAGGLGSPALMYLAGAGVGRLGIVDDDVVERSNLHRQVIHADADIGRSKVDSAVDWVEAHNPDVDVEGHELTLDAENVEEVVAGYDLVVDATDRFAARFLLNDVCVLAEIPLVHGAVYRFEGQVAAFDPANGGPCYRCLFPEAPPPGSIPDCATAGVLGPVPGIIGGFEAAEAIKIVAGIGTPITDRLLVLDIFGTVVDVLEIRPDPRCPVCGEEETIASIAEVDYTDRCRVRIG